MGCKSIKYVYNFFASYGKILDKLSSIKYKMKTLNQILKPDLSHIKSISIDLTPGFIRINSLYYLFRVFLSCSLLHRIGGKVYYRKKRKLFSAMENLHKKTINMLICSDYYTVDRTFFKQSGLRKCFSKNIL